MGDIKQHMFDAEPLHFVVDGPGNDVTGCQLGAVVKALHESFAVGQAQMAALAAHRLGDQEIADGRVKQAGWVELVKFQIRHPAPGAPSHGDTIAGRPVRIRRIEIDPACSARRKDGGLADEAFHQAGRAV